MFQNAIKKIRTFLVVTVSAALLVGCFYFSYEKLNDIFVEYEKTDFQRLPENSLDVLVLGSSHAQYSFNPPFYFQKTGLYSYVLGSACQPLSISYEMLKEALKTQHPKLLILEAYTAMPLRSLCEGDACYVLAAQQMSGQERLNTISNLPDEKLDGYYNEFLNRHNDWKTMESLEEMKKRLYPENQLQGDFGYVYQCANLPANDYWYVKPKKADREIALDEKDLGALNRIYDLCQKEGMDILMYKTPMDSVDAENNSYLAAVWKWAEERDIPYIDFLNHVRDYEFMQNIHADSYHCNLNGAGLITNVLAEKSLSQTNFSHVKNKQLDENYVAWLPWFNIECLRCEANPAIYLKHLEKIHSYVLIRYEKTDKKMRSEIKDYFAAQHLDVGENENCFAILFEDQILAVDNKEVNCEILGKNVQISEKGIFVDGVGMDLKGNLNFVIYDQNMQDFCVKSVSYSFDSLWDYNYHSNYGQK